MIPNVTPNVGERTQVRSKAPLVPKPPIGSASPTDAFTPAAADGIFVYGTLRQGRANDHWIAPHVVRVQPATAQGLLYDLGPYPAMTLEARAPRTIQGEFVTVKSFDAALKDLDELEGHTPGARDNLYDRTIVPVRLANGQTHHAYVYVMIETPAGAPLVESVNGVCDWTAHGVREEHNL